MAAAPKAQPKKAKVLRVTAPLVQAVVGGRPVQFREGDILPGGASEESVNHLKSIEYVEEIDAPEGDK